MPSLSEILSPVTPIKVPFGSVIVNAKIRPDYLTPEFQDRLKGLGEQEESSDAFLDMFIELVAEWDLKYEDTDEKPIELSRKGLHKMPFKIMSKFITAAQEASVPNETTEPGSGDTSLPADSSATSQSGTHF